VKRGMFVNRFILPACLFSQIFGTSLLNASYETPAVISAPSSPVTISGNPVPVAPSPSLPLLRYCGIRPDPISVNLKGAEISDVLDMFARKSGVNLIYDRDIHGLVTVRLDEVPMDEALQAILNLKGLAAWPESSRIIRILSAKALAEQEANQTLVTKVIRLKFARADDIKPQLDALRSSAGRKGSISVNASTNSIVVKDTRLGVLEAEQILSELDRQPIQVAIEVRVVEIERLSSTDLGVQWGAASTLSSGNNTVNLGSSDIPGASSSGGQGTSTNGAAGVVAAQRIANVGGQTVMPMVPGLGVGPNALGNTQGVMSLGVIGNAINFNLVLNALAQKNKMRVLSSPQILTLDNQQASILVGSEIPYAITTISPGVGQTQSYTFVDVGIKLFVTPTVNEGGRITLRVAPEVSTVTSVSPGAPPTINTRKADTTVIIHNGETMVIGGLISDSDQQLASQVPFMGSIPIIGIFFRNTSKSKDRTELMVFLTPKIVEENGSTYTVPPQTPEQEWKDK